MTTRGNRGFAASLVDDIADDEGQELSPAEGIMQSRSDSLGRIATGKIVTDRTEFVDPARCRPWRLHNRDLEKLNEANCSDLIETFKSAGRQRIPALVRKLRDDPDHDFEIIAVVRRWWTVQWLREHHHPEFDYLVTIQNMTDEEAFSVADLENRARKDITDMERANEYLRALAEFYDGSQNAMAERLNVSKSWISHILNVGRLSKDLVAAYADSHDVTVRVARDLGPLAKAEDSFARMIAEATRIQNERAGGLEIAATDVTKRLLKAAAGGDSASRVRSETGELPAKSGRPMLKYSRGAKGGGLTIKFLNNSGAGRDEILKAVDSLLREMKP
jgi:ParB family chromosome partitioning protein